MAVAAGVKALVVDRITPTSMTHLSEFQPSISLSNPNLGLVRLQMPPVRTAYQKAAEAAASAASAASTQPPPSAMTQWTEASGNISVDLHYDTKSTLKRTKVPSHLRVSIVHAQNAAHAASRTRESR